MLSIWIAVALITLDGTIASVALPLVSADLRIDPASSIWIVNTYQIGMLLLLLPLATLGDVWGHRSVFCGGLVVFSVASIGSAFAPSLPALAAFRLFQGFGAAGFMAVIAALVRFTFPLPLLGRGMGHNALAVALCSAMAPAFAALLLESLSWRWLFAINLPFGLTALAIGWRYLPASPRSAKRVDFVSVLLNAMAFGSFFLAVTSLSHGRSAAWWLPLLLIAIFTGVSLVRRESHVPNPLFPIDLLRIPVLRLAYFTSFCASAAAMVGIVALPFLLRLKFGSDNIRVGLMLSAMAAGMAVTAPIAGHLSGKISAGVLGAIGLLVSAAGWMIMTVLPQFPPTVLITSAMLMCGAGFGLFQTPNNREMMMFAPSHRSGAAGGMLSIARLMGQSTGALINVTMFNFFGPDTWLTMLSACLLTLLGAVVCLCAILSQNHRQSPGQCEY